MRRTCMLLVIIVIFACSEKHPKEIVIDLEKREGFGPFAFNEEWCFEEERDNYAIDKSKITTRPENLSLRLFHLQPTQFFYKIYLLNKDKIDSVEFENNMAEMGSSISKLSKKDVDESILLAIGTKDKSTSIVYIDTNNDEKLIDESPLIFKIYKSFEEELEAQKILKPINVAYEYFDGSNIINEQVLILVNPYKGRVGFSGSHANQHFLGASVYEHRVGTINLNNESYSIAISNGHTTATFHPNNVKMLVEPKLDDSAKTIKKQSDPYEIGDVVKIEKYYLEFTSIDIRGTQITLKYLGENYDPTGLHIGYLAPVIETKDVNGKDFNLKQLRGKYVLLDFWGTWCGPCIAEFPKLKSLYQKYSQDDFEIVGIAFDNEQMQVKKFISKYQIPWINLYQNRQDFSLSSLTIKYKVTKILGRETTVPRTFLISPEGRILAKDLRGEELEKELSKYLD